MINKIHKIKSRNLKNKPRGIKKVKRKYKCEKKWKN